MTRCACGAKFTANTGRGRPRLRCETCAADRSALGKKWRAVNAAKVDLYNRARCKAYATNREVEQARGRLHYALRVRRRVAQAQRELDQAIARAA